MNTPVFPFVFHDQEIRVVSRDGEAWFPGTDTARILGYADPDKAIRSHCKAAEILKPAELAGLGLVAKSPRGLVLIPERDVYRLVMKSKLPAAEAFEEMVVSKVLPTIRRTGSFGVGERPDLSRVIAMAEAAILASQNAVKVLTPKAQAYHSLTCMDGLHTLTDAAKLCGQTRNQFLSKLEAICWIYRSGGTGRWQGKADKIKAGFLMHKYHETRDVDGHLKERSQVVVTDQGVAKLRLILSRLETIMLEGDAA
ncbi:antirepressor [Acetobacter tropicalis]|uniref:Antirepressor n=1 Tax=Acetobacter tropicalis TaxID=104102 RepID=A0A149TVL2_9PROT|nr:phage antirepressor KilAC domain-containing protein [Acetobacter tropicalis]KXV57146.1 antirepressor [Acetobacter tropicalis]